jgi:D-lactate dehydrogenase
MTENRPIVFFELEDWERDSLAAGPLAGQPLRCHGGRLGEENSDDAAGAEIVSVFIYSRLDACALARLEGLRLITTRSTGYDHIDLDACRARGVTVCNVPHYGENTVAEHTFALILAVSRKIHKAYLRTSRFDFSLEGLRGMDLKGKTLGVVGAGSIGLHVIRIAGGFGMSVLAYDPGEQALLAEVLGFEYAPLERVLREADVLTLHAPLLPGTRHMINKENIRWMKRGAILVNTARGGLIDTDALVMALDEGILAGAGLDVFEGEELIREEAQLLGRGMTGDHVRTLLQDYNLLRRESVVITPHIGFYSAEAQQRILDTTVENILSFQRGAPQHVVGEKRAPV